MIEHAIRRCVAAAVLVWPALVWGAAEPQITALVGGRLVDGTGKAPIDDAVVVIRGDRVVAAGARDKVSVPSGATVLRVEGKTVMPGMIEHSGRDNLKKLIVAGAPIAMGTDKGTRLNFHESMNHVREMEMYVELGMSPMDVLVSATRRGAELLRKDKDFGTVEAGKLADVIVVEGNPLERISALRNVKVVFKGGVRYK